MFRFPCDSIVRESKSSEEEDSQEAETEEEEEEDDELDEYGLGDRDRSEFCSAFTLIDKDGDGVISPRAMEHVLESLGREPTEENMSEMMAYCGVNGADDTPGMDFNGFYKYLAAQLVDTGNVSELKNALEVFDAVSPVDGSVLPGLTDLQALRHSLKHNGMKFTDEELDYLWEEENNWMLEEQRIETAQLIRKIMDTP